MTFDSLSGHTYISLTTYRRDGRPVATPVQFARDGARLLVNTGKRSGKVKRLRHTPQGTIVACDMRGRTKSEELIEVRVRFLEGEHYAAAEALMMQASNMFNRVLWRTSNGYRRLVGRADDRLWLELTAAA